MTGISAWVCPSHEPRVVGQLRVALEMLGTGAPDPDMTAAEHLVSMAMKLPPRYGMPIAAAVSGQAVAEEGLVVAARALELALGHEPAILIELREARETVRSFARGPLSQSGGGNVDAFLEARRRHAALLSRFDLLPQRTKRVIDDHLDGKNVDVEKLLEAVATIDEADMRLAA